MNDSSNVATYNQKHKPKFASRAWVINWFVLLALVLLISSTANTLFNWLAYGYIWDGALTIFSALLACVVYFLALDSSKNPSFTKRSMISLVCVFVWAAFLPLILHVFGY